MQAQGWLPSEHSIIGLQDTEFLEWVRPSWSSCFERWKLMSVIRRTNKRIKRCYEFIRKEPSLGGEFEWYV